MHSVFSPHTCTFSQLSPETHSHCSTLQESCKGHAGSWVLFMPMWPWPKEIMGSTVCLNPWWHTHTFTTVAHVCTWAHLALHWGSSSIWPSTGLWRINLFQAIDHIMNHILERSSQTKLWGQQWTDHRGDTKNKKCNLFATHTTVFKRCPDGDRWQRWKYGYFGGFKMICENQMKCFYSTFRVTMCRDVEWSGHVVMHGRGPILTDLATGE